MNESDPRVDATKIAIECLTAWTELGREEAARHIARLQFEVGVEPSQLIAGLLNVGTILLYQAAKNAGAEDLKTAGAAMLQDIARGMHQ